MKTIFNTLLVANQYRRKIKETGAHMRSLVLPWKNKIKMACAHTLGVLPFSKAFISERRQKSPAQLDLQKAAKTPLTFLSPLQKIAFKAAQLTCRSSFKLAILSLATTVARGAAILSVCPRPPPRAVSPFAMNHGALKGRPCPEYQALLIKEESVLHPWCDALFASSCFASSFPFFPALLAPAARQAWEK